MKILLLGAGKTGSLVAEVARERGHEVETVRSAENRQASRLREENLRSVDAVIDFTAPHCVRENIQASVRAGKNMVVGTTGWYADISAVRAEVERHQTGFLFASNFSIGVNLFLDLIRAAAPGIGCGYFAHIYERHHAQKKDAPSGTAATIEHLLEQISGVVTEITSFREGEVVGMHELVLDCPDDTIYLAHDAKSRRGFAAGAVRAVEWLQGKKGFFDFKDVWRDILEVSAGK